MAIILCVAAATRGLLPTKTEELISYALANGWASEELSPYLESTLSILLGSTNSEYNWRINQPLSSKSINVYAFRYPSEVPSHFSKYVGNLTYAGQNNAIILDVAKLVSLSTHIGLFSQSRPELVSHNPFLGRSAFSENNLKFMILWVLGHELGHLLSGSTQASHFSEDNTNAFPKMNKASIKNEYEADRIFSSLLHNATDSVENVEIDIEWFANNLLLLMKRNYRYAVGDIADALGPMMFLTGSQAGILNSSTHPEYFFRAGRLLRLLPHKDQAFFIEHIPKLEKEFSQQTITPGKLIVEGTPVAWVRFPDNANASQERGQRISSKKTPLAVWLNPNTYKVVIEATGYISETYYPKIQSKEEVAIHYKLQTNPNVVRENEEFDEQNLSSIDISKVAIENAKQLHINDQESLPIIWELLQATRNSPLWDIPYYLLANLYAWKGECDAAIDYWLKGLANDKTVRESEISQLTRETKKDFTDISELYDKLVELSNAGGVELANQILDEISYTEQRTSLYKHIQSYLYVRSEKYNAALKVLNKLEEQQIFESETEKYTFYTFEDRAYAFEGVGRIDDAELDFLKFTERVERTSPLLEFYLRQGMMTKYQQLLFQNDFQDIREKDYCNYIKYLYKTGKIEEVHNLFDRIGENPTPAPSDEYGKLANHPICLLGRGQYLVHEGNLKLGGKLCKLASKGVGLDLDDNGTAAKLCWANVLHKLDSDKKASIVYRNLTWEKPTDSDVRRVVGSFELEFGDAKAGACHMRLAEISS